MIDILGKNIDLEVDEIVKGRRLITDNSLFERFSEFAKKAVSYQEKEYLKLKSEY